MNKLKSEVPSQNYLYITFGSRQNLWYRSPDLALQTDFGVTDSK